MTTRLLPAVYTGLPLRLLDCSSCALYHALRQQQEEQGHQQAPVTSSGVMSFVLDAITGAVVVGGATENLVPFPLLRKLHESFASVSQETPRWAAWNTLVADDRLVVLALPCEVPQLMQEFPQYKRLCMCVPSGPLVSRMLFQHKHLEAFYAEDLGPAMTALASAGGYSWTAWLRSSLTCRFEGLYVPAIRVAESAAHLLSADGGCERVV
ncbi:hypothetical protein DQ04_01671120, partial [Trypanosoma grayi]|uniref:hypothetical protein n=1 Tax=Trypanosoma grayi TaxID=71804 RepID=UPI0004F41F17